MYLSVPRPNQPSSPAEYVVASPRNSPREGISLSVGRANARVRLCEVILDWATAAMTPSTSLRRLRWLALRVVDSRQGFFLGVLISHGLRNSG